mgnify:CR=1 FL=1
MTEPNAGSAVTDLNTNAVEVKFEINVSGRKLFQSNSPDADIFYVCLGYQQGINVFGYVLCEGSMDGFACGKQSRYIDGIDVVV